MKPHLAHAPHLKHVLACIVCLTALAGCGSRSPGAAYELAAQGAHAASLSATSDLALIGSLNHGGSLWRTGDHARLFSWNHRPGTFSQLVATAFSPDGTRAVTTDPRTLVVWDTSTGDALAYWATPGAALDVAITSDGRVLVGMTDHSAVLFDGGSGRHLHTFLHEGSVGSVAVTTDGRWMLTGSDDGTAVLWDAASGAALHRFRHDRAVRTVALSSRGRYAFSADAARNARIFSGADGNVVLQLPSRSGAITSAGFSSDERYLLVGYVNHAIELWDVVEGRRLDRWETTARASGRPSGAAVLAVGFSPEPERFFAVTGDGRLVTLQRG